MKRGQCYTLQSLAHATIVVKNLKLKPPNPDWFSERKKCGNGITYKEACFLLIMKNVIIIMLYV